VQASDYDPLAEMAPGERQRRALREQSACKQHTFLFLKIINSRKNHNLETAEQLRSPFLWLLALFASIVVLIANVYIGGAAKAQLSSLADATRVNALLSELDLFMVVVGGVATPLAGVVLWLTGFPLVATLVCLMTAGAALLAAFAGSLPLYAQYLLILLSRSRSLSLSLSLSRVVIRYVTFSLVAAGVPGVWGLSSDFVAQTYGEETFGK
jgi:hypothetical protein